MERRAQHEEGFMLVGLIAVIFIILLVLAVAAPTVAKSLRREKEVEAIRRGNQYVRAIQLYYRKTGQYPGSIDQLEKTNNIRFLRQRYVDPMTGKPDWRLIHTGEAKTTVKGFFGKPLAGLAGGSGIAGSSTPGQSVGGGGVSPVSGAGSGSSFGSSSFGGSAGSSGAGAAGSGSSFGSNSGSSSGSSFGSSSGSDSTGSAAGSSFGSSSPSAGGMGGGSAGAVSTVGAGGAGSSSGIGSQSASTFSGGGAPIVGISSMAPGDSITVLNEQKTYATWEFLYDPRIEQLKANTSLLGGDSSGTPASSFGTGAGFGTPGAPVNGTAAPSGSFGSPGATTPSAPTPPPGTPPQ